ncbi:hypothetical protein DMENIID0001_055340 [Sergentomyia squamirostris]
MASVSERKSQIVGNKSNKSDFRTRVMLFEQICQKDPDGGVPIKLHKQEELPRPVTSLARQNGGPSSSLDRNFGDNNLRLEHTSNNQQEQILDYDDYSDFDDSDDEPEVYGATAVSEVQIRDQNNQNNNEYFSDSSFDTDTEDEFETEDDINRDSFKSFEDFRDSQLDSDFDHDDDDEYEPVAYYRQNSGPSKVQNLINELIKTEETYINTIKSGMTAYMKVLDPRSSSNNSTDLPDALQGKDVILFGNLTRVYNFHTKILLPEIKATSECIEMLSNVFLKLISEEQFYIHVTYARNIPKVEKILKDHNQFFASCMDKIGDKLGIQSLVLQPIQRLPRYGLLLENILHELAMKIEESPGIKDQVGVLSRALKAVTRLTECVNASVNVNDITGCPPDYLQCQGKFRNMDAFEIYDYATKRRFKGHLFLFDKCIVFTENKQTTDDPTFRYRGYYNLSRFGMLTADNYSKLTIYSNQTRQQQQLDIYAPSPTISKWEDYISTALKTVEERKLFPILRSIY